MFYSNRRRNRIWNLSKKSISIQAMVLRVLHDGGPYASPSMTKRLELHYKLQYEEPGVRVVQ
jgi:hypothetical protein